jgi:hypothetical protein
MSSLSHQLTAQARHNLVSLLYSLLYSHILITVLVASFHIIHPGGSRTFHVPFRLPLILLLKNRFFNHLKPLSKYKTIKNQLGVWSSFLKNIIGLS